VKKPGLWLALVGFLGIVAVGAWLGNSWFGTYQQAQQVQSEVRSVEASLRESQWEALPDQVTSLTESAGGLQARTRQAPWRLLEALPVIGPSAAAVTALTQSLASIGEATEPLAPLAQRIVQGQIRRPDGSVDLAALEQAAPRLEVLSERIEIAIDRLDGVDVDAVRPEIGEPVAVFRDELDGLLPTLRTASTLATWLPGLLGADGPRDWLIMLQNPAEARGSGGLIGGYVVARADDGRLAFIEDATTTDYAAEPIPIESAPLDARETWGDGLGRWGAFNASPHFPMTAALAADGVAAMGQSVGGVIAVDPQGMSSVLEVTGPVSAMGETITAQDAAQFITVDVYREYPDAVERDEVTMALVRAAFDALVNASWTPRTMADALRAPIEDQRIRVWSSQADEQEWLERSPLSGTLTDQPGSVVAVAFNNAARNKVDAFVQAEVDYTAGRCPTATQQESTLTVTLRNDPPADVPRNVSYAYYANPEAPYGTTRMLVHLYAPVLSNYQFSTLDGEDVPLYLASERNRPVWWTYIDLPPGAERVLEVSFFEPSELGTEPEVIVQPMVKDEIVRVVERRQC